MSGRFQALEKIAPKLNALQEDPNARVHYELMSDGLVWSDELPAWDQLEPGETHCLRGVWRYRSSLITGAPEDKYRQAWEQAQALFPNWPGFLPRRQLGIWREIFAEQRKKLIADWEALETKYDCRQPQAPEDAAAAG